MDIQGILFFIPFYWLSLSTFFRLSFGLQRLVLNLQLMNNISGCFFFLLPRIILRHETVALHSFIIFVTIFMRVNAMLWLQKTYLLFLFCCLVHIIYLYIFLGFLFFLVTWTNVRPEQGLYISLINQWFIVFRLLQLKIHKTKKQKNVILNVHNIINVVTTNSTNTMFMENQCLSNMNTTKH